MAEAPRIIRRPRSRANDVELAERSEAAAFLLASGAPRTVAVSELAARYGVSRRQARRYVAKGAKRLRVEVGNADLLALLGESVERLRRLAHACEASGSYSAAVGAEKAAAGAIAAMLRLDTMAIGHTLAIAESVTTPQSGARFRRPIRAPDEAPPF